HGAAVLQRDTRGLAAFNDDAVELDLGGETPARRDEGLEQGPRQIARAALAELVAALQVEGADHRAHRARLRHGVDQPGAEQRNLEQEEQLDVLVLEQLLDHVERLPLGRSKEVATNVALAQERLAL